MGKPSALKPGDTISLVSPASPLTPDQTETGIRLLEEQGYKVKTYPSTYTADGFLAGDDASRAKDLTDAFHDPETQAVYCARGGYGCSRLMPYLDFDKVVATEKMFIGFSDITVLHAALNRRGLPTVHGPMALTLGYEREPWVYESFFATLRGDNPIPATAKTGVTLKDGTAEGELVGGCMILICDLIGTPEQIDMTNKIVLIEDVDEAPHRVDAMLTHLLNSQSLTKAAGIVMGEMTRTDEKPDKMIGAKPWREIVAERLSGLDIPIIIDYPCGHAPQMLTLPLGLRVAMDASRGTMNYTEPLCK